MAKKSGSLEGASILVVEDHAKLLRNIAFLLQIAGMNVVTAANCAEAQQILSQQKADLILADIDMCNGYEFLSIIHAERRNAATPFIAMSEKYELHDLMRAMDLGATDYLPKPFDAYDLANVVRENLPDTHHHRKAS